MSGEFINDSRASYVGCYFFQQPVRRKYFDGLGFPYHFYGPEEYSRWLIEAGLNPLRVELAPKVMTRKASHDNSLQLV